MLPIINALIPHRSSCLCFLLLSRSHDGGYASVCDGSSPLTAGIARRLKNVTTYPLQLLQMIDQLKLAVETPMETALRLIYQVSEQSCSCGSLTPDLIVHSLPPQNDAYALETTGLSVTAEVIWSVPNA